MIAKIPNKGGVFIDAYNQSINEDIAGTITTRVDASNLTFVTDMQYKGKEIHPYESFYWNDTEAFFRGSLGNGIARCVKTDDSLAVMEEVKDTICLNSMVGEPSEDWQTVVGNKQLNPFRGSVEGTSPCITSACGAGGGMTPMLTDADLETTKTKEFIEQVRGHEDIRYRIRKLTPRECFRLMGVDDADIDKIQASGISNSQQYKCAGNSIVVDVLYHLFRKMFCETENESDQLTLF